MAIQQVPKASAIYSVNRGSNPIGSASLGGTGVDENFITGAQVSAGFGVAVDAAHIYWANQDGTITSTGRRFAAK